MTTNTSDPSTASRVSVTVRRRPPARPVRQAVACLSREFHDLPGLTLTIGQARRLTGFDHATAEDALRALAAAGIVVQESHGAFRCAERSRYRP